MISKTLFGLLLCYVLVSVCSADPAPRSPPRPKPATVVVVNATSSNATKDAVLAKFIDGFVTTLEPLTPRANSLIANVTKVISSSKKVFADLKVCSKALKAGKATQAQREKAAASVQALGKDTRGVILQLSSLAKVAGTALDGLFNSTVNVLPKLNLTLVAAVPAGTAAKATTAAPKKG